MVHRELPPLISTEVNRRGCPRIQEGDGREHDCFPRYILDETKLRLAHSAAYGLTSSWIRNESYEVRPAPLKQKTRKQP